MTRIAEKKLAQLGGDVCGVLVRNEAGAWAAVSEGGRVMWLDDFEGQPSSAQPEQPGDGVVPTRDDLIQCLLATRAQSEGVMADAILSMLTTPQPEGDGWIKCIEDQPLEIDVDVKLRDGSVIRGCLAQSDGDFYWKGGGSEMFILEHEVIEWRPQPPKEGEGDE